MDKLEITFKENLRSHRVIHVDCEIVRMAYGDRKWAYSRKGMANALRELRTQAGRRMAYRMALYHRIVNPPYQYLESRPLTFSHIL